MKDHFSVDIDLGAIGQFIARVMTERDEAQAKLAAVTAEKDQLAAEVASVTQENSQLRLWVQRHREGNMTPPPPPVECYRTGIRGRFVCLGRWKKEPGRWCAGCKRKAGL